MTAFNFGSPTGNVIVPVSNFTQQTKELDITNYVTSSVGTINTSTARAVFSADSSGAWHISLNIGITYSTVVNMSGGNNITIGGIYFKYVNNNYAATVAAFSSAGTPVAAQVEAIANHAYFTTYTAATDIQYFRITYSGPLLAEPIWASLGTTALAAKEGNVNVSAYFPVASGTTPGLVDGNAATWNGVKTFNNDIVAGGAINGNINSRMNVLISSIPTNPSVWETGPAGPGSNAFYGGVLLPNGKVFAIPCSYTGTNTIYNPTTNAWETGPAGLGSGAFTGGVLLPNGKVFAIPLNYTGTSTIYNPAVVGWPYGQWMLHSMFNKF